MASRIRNWIEREARDRCDVFMAASMLLGAAHAFEAVRAASASERLSPAQRVTLGAIAEGHAQPAAIRDGARLVLDGDTYG